MWLNVILTECLFPVMLQCLQVHLSFLWYLIWMLNLRLQWRIQNCIKSSLRYNNNTICAYSLISNVVQWTSLEILVTHVQRSFMVCPLIGNWTQICKTTIQKLQTTTLQKLQTTTLQKLQTTTIQKLQTTTIQKLQTTTLQKLQTNRNAVCK